MMNKQSVLDWVSELKDNEFVAIEEGGLMLVALDADGEELGGYIEIGGTPDPAEDEDER